jgi:hypothetical protein
LKGESPSTALGNTAIGDVDADVSRADKTSKCDTHALDIELHASVVTFAAPITTSNYSEFNY